MSTFMLLVAFNSVPLVKRQVVLTVTSWSDTSVTRTLNHSVMFNSINPSGAVALGSLELKKPLML